MAGGRWRRWGVVLLLATVAAAGLVLLGPARAAAAGAGRADARLGGRRLTELLSATPPGRPLLFDSQRFRQVMGYRPATARLPGDPAVRAVKPTGACSSPLGATSFRFGLACKAHDLGYDLLRFAARTGRPLGADARQQLDDRFERDLHAQCATRQGAGRRACDALANLYAGGARLNSWRQHYRAP
jgi:Prokaryotic phospholipase A2